MRYEKQHPLCEFGRKGVCCVLCSEGPCRISDKASLGVCGLHADQIVAISCVACHVHVCENTAEMLRHAAGDELKGVCGVLGIAEDASVPVLSLIYRKRSEIVMRSEEGA